MGRKGGSSGKELALVDSPISQGEGEDRSPSPQRKRPRNTDKQAASSRSKKKTAASSSASTAKTKKNPWTKAQRVQMLKKINIEATRWVDKQILVDLGIFNEVKALLENMGLGSLFEMEWLTHEEETRQFFSSMHFYDNKGLALSEPDSGRLVFTIHGQEYWIEMHDLARLYGVTNEGEEVELHYDEIEVQGVWGMIAEGEPFHKGKSKAASIRHPAIRYVHKVLASTLFARKETGYLLSDEMLLLIHSLRPFLATLPNGEEIKGQARGLNLPHFIVRRLCYYCQWVFSHKDASPELHCGGLITPLLHHFNIPIKQAKKEPVLAKLDAPALATTKFLVGRIKRRYCYKFKLDNEVKTIALPNPECTYFGERSNVFFKPPTEHLYVPNRDGRMQSVKSHPSQPSEADEVMEEAAPVYGSQRYHFDPYSGPVSGEALRAAHERIDLLQRMVKWQGKQIKNVVSQLKKQGKKLKKALARLSPTKSSSSSSTQDIAREQRGKAPVSPSSSGSGNLDYDLECSSESSPEF